MKTRSAFLLSLSLLLSCLWLARLDHFETVASSTYPVHNLDTGLNYTTIQEAIDANETLDGHTIYVERGTYYEHVAVNKTVSIIGENETTTVIDGNGSGLVVEVIFAPNVTLENLTMRNGTFGLYIWESSPVRLRHVNLMNNKYNLNLGASIPTIQNSIHDIDDSNTVDGKPICFWVNRENEEIPKNAGFVSLINCSNMIVRDLTLANNWDGITLMKVKNSLIENVTISNTGGALFMSYVSNCTVQKTLVRNNNRAVSLENSDSNNFIDNVFTDNGDNDAIYIEESSSNVLRRNIISNNSQIGIYLSESSHNLITENTITNNSLGINLGYSFSNDLSKNQISANVYHDVWLFNSSDNRVSGNEIMGKGSGNLAGEQGIVLYYSNSNSITENIIKNNYYGIEVYDSTNNSIFHNDFVDNTIQAAFPNFGFVNYWDDNYPSGGNYWSDYLTKYLNASEIDNSGIWNTSYVIYANNIDHYPQMKPITIPEFPSFLILPLFMIATLLAVIVYRRKHPV